MYSAGIFNFGSNPLGGSWYANIRLAAEPEPFYDNLTKTTFGDPIEREFQAFNIFNIGSYVELGAIDVFAGVGIAAGDGYARLDDPTNILGDKYYVKDSSQNETKSNINAGLAFRFSSRYKFIASYDSAPATYFFGLGIAFN